MRQKILCAVSAVCALGIGSVALAGGHTAEASVSDDGKSIVVRTYRCGTPAHLSLAAKAEGLVNGERKSLTLDAARSPEAGVFTVARTWPADGKWILTFTLQGGQAANVIVELAPGSPLRIASQEFTYEKPTPKQIEVALNKVAR